MGVRFLPRINKNRIPRVRLKSHLRIPNKKRAQSYGEATAQRRFGFYYL